MSLLAQFWHTLRKKRLEKTSNLLIGGQEWRNLEPTFFSFKGLNEFKGNTFGYLSASLNTLIK